jgi:hypothetical protein
MFVKFELIASTAFGKINSLVEFMGDARRIELIRCQFVTDPQPSSISLLQHGCVKSLPSFGAIRCMRWISVGGTIVLVFGLVNFFKGLIRFGSYLENCVSKIINLGSQSLIHVVDPDDHAHIGTQLTHVDQPACGEPSTFECCVEVELSEKRWARSMVAATDLAKKGRLSGQMAWGKNNPAQKTAELRFSLRNAILERDVNLQRHNISFLSATRENSLGGFSHKRQRAGVEFERITVTEPYDLNPLTNKSIRLNKISMAIVQMLTLVHIRRVVWGCDWVRQFKAKSRVFVSKVKAWFLAALNPHEVILMSRGKERPRLGQGAPVLHKGILKKINAQFGRGKWGVVAKPAEAQMTFKNVMGVV